jgi:hypothetical protein
MWNTASKYRWLLYCINAESSGNVGTDLRLVCYADDGSTQITSPWTITRSTGLMTVAGDPTAALGVVTKQYADKMLPLAGGTMTGGLSFGAVLAASTSDLSKHITLHTSGQRQN